MAALIVVAAIWLQPNIGLLRGVIVPVFIKFTDVALLSIPYAVL